MKLLYFATAQKIDPVVMTILPDERIVEFNTFTGFTDEYITQTYKPLNLCQNPSPCHADPCPRALNIFKAFHLFNNLSSIESIGVSAITSEGQIKTERLPAGEGLVELFIVIYIASRCPTSTDSISWSLKYHGTYCSPQILFYNIFSAATVQELLLGSGNITLNEVTEKVVKAATRVGVFFKRAVELARNANTTRCDAGVNAMIALEALSNIFELQLMKMIEEQRKMIQKAHGV